MPQDFAGGLQTPARINLKAFPQNTLLPIQGRSRSRCEAKLYLINALLGNRDSLCPSLADGRKDKYKSVAESASVKNRAQTEPMSESRFSVPTAEVLQAIAFEFGRWSAASGRSKLAGP